VPIGEKTDFLLGREDDSDKNGWGSLCWRRGHHGIHVNKKGCLSEQCYRSLFSVNAHSVAAIRKEFVACTRAGFH